MSLTEAWQPSPGAGSGRQEACELPRGRGAFGFSGGRKAQTRRGLCSPQGRGRTAMRFGSLCFSRDKDYAGVRASKTGTACLNPTL